MLALADAIACEDTRHSAPLLRHLGIGAAAGGARAQRARRRRRRAQRLAARRARRGGGQRCRHAGRERPRRRAGSAAVQRRRRRAILIPGASSAGGRPAWPAIRAQRQGHRLRRLPARQGRRAQRCAAAAARGPTAILFEAPHRIERRTPRWPSPPARTSAVTLCRELTKQFESVHTLRCVLAVSGPPPARQFWSACRECDALGLPAQAGGALAVRPGAPPQRALQAGAGAWRRSAWPPGNGRLMPHAARGVKAAGLR